MDTSTSYRYHRIKIQPAVEPSVSYDLNVAELIMNHCPVSVYYALYKFSVVLDTYDVIKSWLAKMAWECRCYFRFAPTRAELILRPDTITSLKTITPNMICASSDHKTTMKQRRSGLEEVINKIEVHYNRDSSNSSYRAISKTSDTTSISQYGEKEQPELFKFDFVQSSTMAVNLRDFYLARYKDRKKILEFDAFLDNSELEFADGITIYTRGGYEDPRIYIISEAVSGEDDSVITTAINPDNALPETPLTWICEIQSANTQPGSARENRNDKIQITAREY
jgi:hypothetical protein